MFLFLLLLLLSRVHNLILCALVVIYSPLSPPVQVGDVIILKYGRPSPIASTASPLQPSLMTRYSAVTEVNTLKRYYKSKTTLTLTNVHHDFSVMRFAFQKCIILNFTVQLTGIQ